jgi:hypothetical protein
LTTTKSEITFEEILNPICDSPSNLTSFNDRADGEDKDDDEGEPELGKLSEGDGRSWVMGIISKTVGYRMGHLWHKQMKIDELKLPSCGDAAYYFHKRHTKNEMLELTVPTVFELQTDNDAALSGPTTVGETMETLDRVPGKLQMPHLTSQL